MKKIMLSLFILVISFTANARVDYRQLEDDLEYCMNLLGQPLPANFAKVDEELYRDAERDVIVGVMNNRIVRSSMSFYFKDEYAAVNFATETSLALMDTGWKFAGHNTEKIFFTKNNYKLDIMILYTEYNKE
ncbi:MAG: hypothetical protein FWF73_01925 [Spirochaetes bacterium]|nr:hypothetical protein [Spirochaetota bacterium]